MQGLPRLLSARQVRQSDKTTIVLDRARAIAHAPAIIVAGGVDASENEEGSGEEQTRRTCSRKSEPKEEPDDKLRDLEAAIAWFKASTTEWSNPFYISRMPIITH